MLNYLGLYHDSKTGFAQFCKKITIQHPATLEKIPFVPNSSQARHIIEWKPRSVILKARQIGFTTLKLFELMFWASKLHGAAFGIVLHDERNTKSKIERIQYEIEQYGENLGIKVDPKHASTDSFRINTYNDSRTQVEGFVTVLAGSGAAKNTFVSQTLHYLHLCLGSESKVILSSGESKAIKDIEVGDTVLTSDGTIAPVKNKVYTGKKDTNLLKTWYTNEPITLSDEHKVLTIEGWKQCKDLTLNDYIALPKIALTNKITEYHYKLNNISQKKNSWKKRIEEDTIPLDYDFGYYLGYYLAEGHCEQREIAGKNKLGKIIFAYHINEEYYKKAIKFAEKYATSILSYVEPEKNTGMSKCYGIFLASLTESICGRTTDKHIPEWFFDTNEKFIEGVLSGYFSGDGSKNAEKKKIESNITSATCVCEKISRQIRRLILAMQYGVPGVSYKKDRYRYEKKTKPIYITKCSGEVAQKMLKLMDARCRDTEFNPNVCKYKNVDGQYFIKIKELKTFENEDTYDIEIDHPTHDFETTCGIVSNSELPRFTNPASLWDGIEPTLIQTEGMVQMEATPNGYNLFHELYTTAKDSKWTCQTDYQALFYPWTSHKEYSLTPPKDWEPCDDDMAYIDKYGITPSQAYWRRKVVFKGNTNPTKKQLFTFEREYPASDETCWAETADNSPFQLEALKKMTLANPCSTEDSGIRIYQTYDPRKDYTMGVDVAEGASKGGDDNAFAIIDNEGEIAVLYSSDELSYLEYGALIYQTALRYFADVVIEINKDYGSVIADYLEQSGYRIDKITRFRTTGTSQGGGSRPEVIAALDKWIVTHDKIKDEQLRKQMVSFSKVKSEQRKKTDDLVMALGFAVHKLQSNETESVPYVSSKYSSNRKYQNLGI